MLPLISGADNGLRHYRLDIEPCFAVLLPDTLIYKKIPTYVETFL